MASLDPSARARLLLSHTHAIARLLIANDKMDNVHDNDQDDADLSEEQRAHKILRRVLTSAQQQKMW